MKIEEWFTPGEVMVIMTTSGKEIVCEYKGFKVFNEYQYGYIVSFPMVIEYIELGDERRRFNTRLTSWMSGRLSNEPGKEILINNTGIIAVDKATPETEKLYRETSKYIKSEHESIRLLSETPDK